MRQKEDENNEDYVKRFNGNAQTLELAGGAHIFFGPQLVESADPDSPTEDEWLF